METVILIVDDFQIMRKTVKHQLRSMGYSSFLEAVDGRLALETLRGNRVDLVIADWNMPNMSGLDFLREARNDEKTKNIPFIMLTAEATEDAVIKALQAGANDYIVKPFTHETLIRKVRNVLARAAGKKIV